jgi:hypothetical protein
MRTSVSSRACDELHDQFVEATTKIAADCPFVYAILRRQYIVSCIRSSIRPFIRRSATVLLGRRARWHVSFLASWVGLSKAANEGEMCRQLLKENVDD